MHQPVKYLPRRNRLIPTLLFAVLTWQWVYKLPVAWRLPFQNGLKCLGVWWHGDYLYQNGLKCLGVWFFDFHQLCGIFSTDFHLELYPLQRLHLWSCCSKVPGWYQFSCPVVFKVGHICGPVSLIFLSFTAITAVAHHAQFSMFLS